MSKDAKRPFKGHRAAEIPEEFVALDIETTGLNPNWDEIIEVSAVRYQNGCEVGAYESLVKPSRPISAFITLYNGITNGMVADVPTVGEIMAPLRAFIGDSILVGHNVHLPDGLRGRTPGTDTRPVWRSQNRARNACSVSAASPVGLLPVGEEKADQPDNVFRRSAFSALPVFDRALGYAEQIGKFLLRETRCLAQRSDIRHSRPRLSTSAGSSRRRAPSPTWGCGRPPVRGGE